MDRRLAAILSYDVVGYSLAMGRDETGTLARLKSHRREVIDPQAAQHGGRTIKLIGDGALMEFASVVDAVTFAVAMQTAVAERNANLPEAERLKYRIGINIGDVIIDGDDIYGDGVNVAARIEGLGEAGGICVSRNVRNQVRDKLDLNFDDLGEIEVKNIERPVRAFHVVLNEKAGALAASLAEPAQKPHSRLWQAAAGLALSLVLIAGLSWWQPWGPEFEPALVEEMVYPLPNKPSIAVLPFTNMSDDPKQEYFADGMTDDLITDLSKISGLFVIARNSSFAYKGKSPDVRQVSRELGVKYILEGSVRRAGEHVRINAQLIDAITGGHIWAERYDGGLNDVFGLQDNITARIVAALAVHLTASEETAAATRDTDNVAAYDAFLQGWALFNRQTSEDFAKAIPHFEKAIELDPDYGRAYGALALTYFIGSERGLSGALKVPGYLLRQRARKFLDLAMKNPSSVAHIVASLMSLKQRLFGDAVMHIERAVMLDPNNAEAHSMAAYVLVYDGRPNKAIQHAKQAMRLDPNNPSRPLQWIGRAHFAKGDLEEALIWLDRARKHNPTVFPAALMVASASAHLGHVERSRATLDVYVSTWSEPPPLKRIMYYWPFKDAAVAKRFSEGILKAGLPDAPRRYYQVTEEDRLNGEQIAGLVFGRTISGYGLWDDKLWSREFGTDGDVFWRGPPVKEVPWYGPSVEADSGFARVKGDQLCEKWEKMNEGYETCFPVFRYPRGTPGGRDDYLFVTDTGIYSWSLSE